MQKYSLILFMLHHCIPLLICVFEVSKKFWDVPYYSQIYNLTACFENYSQILFK